MPHGSRQGRAVGEMEVMRAFMNALQQTKLEPTSDFFEWGGHSLAAAEVASELGILPALINAYPSARRLAKFLGSSKMNASSPGPSRTHPLPESEGILRAFSLPTNWSQAAPAILPCRLQNAANFSQRMSVHSKDH